MMRARCGQRFVMTVPLFGGPAALAFACPHWQRTDVLQGRLFSEEAACDIPQTFSAPDGLASDKRLVGEQ
jgi:hypothetical protein